MVNEMFIYSRPYRDTVLRPSGSSLFNSDKFKANELLYSNNMQKIVCITIDPELLARLDYCRHSISRSKYLALLVEQHLKVMEIA
jgi:hypothetical protein